jgi:hypothetical protein
MYDIVAFLMDKTRCTYIVSVFWEVVATHDTKHAATQMYLMSFSLTKVLQQHTAWICVSGRQDITKRRGGLNGIPASYSGRFGSPISNFFDFPRSLQAISVSCNATAPII